MHPSNSYECFCNLVDQILQADQSDLNQTLNTICESFVATIPFMKFASILTYNNISEELIYTAVKVKDLYNKMDVIDLLKDNIIISKNNSTSGRLIDSTDNLLKIDDVQFDNDYKSVKLAACLDLKKGIFLKIRELKTKEIYGIVAVYPADDSPIINFNDIYFNVIVHAIENTLSSAKRIREYNILSEILEAAKKVKKDLGSFAQKCTGIISDAISSKGCSLFVLDPYDNLIRLKGTSGIVPGPKFDIIEEFTKKDVFYRYGEGETGKVLQENTPKIFSHSEVSLSKWVESQMSQTYLIVPIPKIGENKAIGVIRCATRPNKLMNSMVESFNQEDLELLNYIANIISVFIEISCSQDSQKQLMAKLPHEIKSSLANIESICEYIAMKLSREKEKGVAYDLIYRKLYDIKEECQLSLMTVDSLHLFDTDIASYDFNKFNLFTGIIAKTRKMLNPIARETRNIEIRYEDRAEFPSMYLDKHKMQTVFYNILINGIKYSTQNNNNTSADILLISGVDKFEQYYTISISNYGIEIPFGREEDVFNNGFRSLEAIKVDPGGRGLGLALVKSILDVHGVRIKVTSRSNPTTFTLYFPISLKHKPPSQTNIREK